MSGSRRPPQGHGTQNPTGINPRRAHLPQYGSSSSSSSSQHPQFSPRYQAGHYSSFEGLSFPPNADVPAQIGGHGEGSFRQQHQQQYFRQFDPTIPQQFQQQPQGSLFDPNVGHLSSTYYSAQANQTYQGGQVASSDPNSVMPVPGGGGFPLLPPAQQQHQQQQFHHHRHHRHQQQYQQQQHQQQQQQHHHHHHHHQQQYQQHHHQQQYQQHQQQHHQQQYQQQQQPPWLQQQPAGQRKRKLSMGDGVGEGASKSRKFSSFQFPISLVPLQDFLSANKDKIIEQFKFSAGSAVGNINPEVIVDVPTGIGQSLIGGYFEEVSVAHERGCSWAGDFDKHDMFVTEKEPTQCTIMKVPSHPATPENVDLDHISLMNCLLSWFERMDGQRPPFFDELFERIRFPVTAEDPVGRDKYLYVLRNHPAFAPSAKRRGFLEDFYKFYKTLSPEERQNFLQHTNHDFFEFMFHQLVLDDDFLLDIFWKRKDLTREQKRIALIQCLKGMQKFPFTSEDLYVAIYLRHLIVHGPEYAKVGGDYFDISLLELDRIGAQYFTWFLPKFMEELLEMVNKYALLMDCWMTYVTREQPLSLSLWSTLSS